MEKSFYNSPAKIDLIGLPKGKYWIQTFPDEMQFGESITLTLNDIHKKVITFSGDNIEPDKQPKQRNKQIRHTEIKLLYPQRIKAMKVFLNMNSKIMFVLGKRDTALLIKPEILVPVEAHIITFFKKKEKRKVINACFLDAGHPVTDIHLAMANCHTLIAMDTNTKEVAGVGKIAATTAIQAHIKIINEACHFQTGPVHKKITIDPPGNPEISGISTMMFDFLEENPHLRDKHIGIIMDTELELIKGMNQRTIPFFQDMLLPAKTSLFYATSDTGSVEFMANKLIRMCDKESTKFLGQFLSNNSHVANDYHKPNN